MKKYIDLIYEMKLNQLKELSQKNKKQKAIYVFYDSSLVDVNSAYIKSKVKYGNIFDVKVYVHDLYTNDLDTNHRLLKEIKDHHFMMFEFPISKPILDQNYFSYLSLDNDIDGIVAPNYIQNDFNLIKYHPATVSAVLEVINYLKLDLKQEDVCILGRSIYLGNYLYQLILKNKPKSIVQINSTTVNKQELIKGSSLVISCINKALVYPIDWLADNTYLIDVTTEYVNNKLKGSFIIDQTYANEHNIKYTPTPGGIGKLTTLFLFNNYFLTTK
ncbi:bifunctional 5,10-methylenetetrahydrofolate dehydrogenase/5,10-methenyltetrahydrofolate cyclohydrolase [Ureaplasma diversum]|uniref:methenyltetrahydrofolate cyclohydrolase n=1 Tax=Ureaplasma diversum NCTC 246 TaxID=1188241 RepID=A0A084F116_9BACT|nr:bifunctional 5,10-methylenetetrahydrofolate dehydrogenase/5,10-methenyltetrahydrofolate cyclohydrolase [Ureaplasma diversum]KEZ23908.1 Methylenetetrahydrofolate dehydrogenase(NADP+)/methenyltetrahydrofolate cyclohydrolase (folD) [Ureaplasma diversum NCTC 246]